MIRGDDDPTKSSDGFGARDRFPESPERDYLAQHPDDADKPCPVAPEEDAIPLSEQREKKLGPDYNPDYFASIDSLIEDAYGPATGDFKSISGR